MRLTRTRTHEPDGGRAAHAGDVGRFAMPRTRGAATGALLVILGTWGAVIPLIGPYFDFVIGPDDAWDMTAGRFWLSLLPGVAVVAGGSLLLAAANRASATLGAQIALAGGIWFAIGPVMSRLWNDGVSQTGPALGGTGRQVAEQLAYHPGLGVLVTALAGIALGRVTTRSVSDVERLERDRELATAPAHEPTMPPPEDEREALTATMPEQDVARPRASSGRFEREPTPVPGNGHHADRPRGTGPGHTRHGDEQAG